VEQKDFVWGLIASMYTGNAMGVLLCLFLVPVFGAIMRLASSTLTPAILLLSMIGAYAVNNSTFDIWLVALVAALVLGDMTEEALRQSLILSDGSLAIFIAEPIAAFFMVIASFRFFLPVLLHLWKRLRGLATQQLEAAHK
jgi:putative tricarboxylic transport membrane protein